MELMRPIQISLHKASTAPDFTRALVREIQRHSPFPFATANRSRVPGFFLLFMGLLSLIYLICALRTNLVFVAIFLGLLLTFVVLTGAYWHTALGHTEMAERLQVAAGAFGFLATLAGWWIFFAQMLASVDFPFQIPVGDISHLITPLSERVKQKERYPA